MKKCDYEDGQEKCERFEPKTRKNWVCLYYREPGTLLDCGVCNGEYSDQDKKVDGNTVVGMSHTKCSLKGGDKT